MCERSGFAVTRIALAVEGHVVLVAASFKQVVRMLKVASRSGEMAVFVRAEPEAGGGYVSGRSIAINPALVLTAVPDEEPSRVLREEDCGPADLVTGEMVSRTREALTAAELHALADDPDSIEGLVTSIRETADRWERDEQRGCAMVHMPKLIADEFGTSRSEARRLLMQGGVRIDGDGCVVDLDVPADRIDGKTLRVGKRRSVVVALDKEGDHAA
jgi:hypothetical protein